MRIGHAQGRSVAFLPSTDIMQGSLEIVVKRLMTSVKKSQIGMHMETDRSFVYSGCKISTLPKTVRGQVLKSILCNLTDDEETRRVPGKAWREASVATAIVLQKDKSLVAHMLCHLPT
eukprot:g57530.t1